MKILAFDTSNNSVSVAISCNGTILSYIEELNPSMQAERIIPMIEQSFEQSALSYDDIDYLGVINGPGSFTGTRVGLSVAQAILFGSAIKGTIVTNFQIAHFRTMQQVKNYDMIIIILSASRNQLYVQIFIQDKESNAPFLIECSMLLDLLVHKHQHIICAGNGVSMIYHQIKHLRNVTILPRFPKIKALHICKYLNIKLKKNNELSPIQPLYITEHS
jgi:tRNA threonylcarbamoyl adenosine modification protein YeaZ